MSDDAKAPAKDVVLLGPPTADGDGVHVIRAREERLEAGELRSLREGRPIVGEIVSLKPREDNPRVCDVASSYAPPKPAPAPSPPARKGPAQIATEAYRENWEGVFGARDRSLAN